MFYINEEKLNSCTRVLICIGNQRVPAAIDTGNQISLLKEELYHELKSEGVEGLELGVQNAVVVSAFGNKSNRIRVQALMPIRIDDTVVDHIFLVSTQLLTQALLGVEVCWMNNIFLNFPEQYFTMEKDGRGSHHHFAYDDNIQPMNMTNIDPADHNPKSGVDGMQVATTSTTNGATADYLNYQLLDGAINKVGAVPHGGSKENGRECPVGEQASKDDDNNCTISEPEQVAQRKRNARFSSNETSYDHQDNRKGGESMEKYDVCAANRIGHYEDGNIRDTETANDTHKTITDDRVITSAHVRELVNEIVYLTCNQKQKLTAILRKHHINLTKNLASVKTLSIHSGCKVSCRNLIILARYHLHCDLRLERKYGNC